jgi:hypothetical protein
LPIRHRLTASDILFLERWQMQSKPNTKKNQRNKEKEILMLFLSRKPSPFFSRSTQAHRQNDNLKNAQNKK